jgi:CelD/BcsL family acetyltransferase involved in cellulose biosynthesis
MSTCAKSRSQPSYIEIDPIADSRWLQFASAHPATRIFHHPAWLALLRDQYAFRVFALCAEVGGALVAGIPFCEIGSGVAARWVCLPFTDQCGPLCLHERDAQALLQYVVSRAVQARVQVEIRDRTPSSQFATLTEHWSHRKSIDGTSEELQRSLHPDIRRRLKKAQQDGLQNEIRRDQLGLETFYRLHLLTRRRQGVPIQPHAYFDRLHRNVLATGLGFVSITHKEDKPLAAAVFTTFNGTLLYKYGASDPAAMGLSPNYVLFWESILVGKELGLVVLDFGKTATDNDGLRFFKNKWKPTEAELLYSFFPSAPKPSRLRSAASSALGSVIRRSPPWVCRMAGELLYRRFGA